MGLALDSPAVLKGFCDWTIQRGLSSFNALDPVSAFIVEDFFDLLASGEPLSESELAWSQEDSFKVVAGQSDWQVITSCGKPFVNIEGFGKDRVIKISLLEGVTLQGNTVAQDRDFKSPSFNCGLSTLGMAAVGLIKQKMWAIDDVA